MVSTALPNSFSTDLGHKNADADQFKAILAAEIIKALDRERLSVRGAQVRITTKAVSPHRVKRPRYSPEFRNAFTISAFSKFPSKLFSLFNQK